MLELNRPEIIESRDGTLLVMFSLYGNGDSRRENGEALQAIVVNNKVSNVCARGDGVQASEDLCAKVAELLSLPGGAESVLPCSTGVSA